MLEALRALRARGVLRRLEELRPEVLRLEVLLAPGVMLGLQVLRRLEGQLRFEGQLRLEGQLRPRELLKQRVMMQLDLRPEIFVQ